jgi:hypothetical protein
MLSRVAASLGPLRWAGLPRVSLRCLATLPHHVVLGLPALSPTMTSGNLGKWIKKEGDAVKAGERIAEVGLGWGGVGWSLRVGLGRGHLPNFPRIPRFPTTYSCLLVRDWSPPMVARLSLSVLCRIRWLRV